MSTSKSKETSAFEQLDPRDILFAPDDGKTLFWNARKILDPESMDKTFASIIKDGLIEDIIVRKLPEGGYQIVAGERRQRCILRALENDTPCFDFQTGDTLPASEVYRSLGYKVLYNCSDKKASTVSVAENLARRDLSEWELMEYCKALDIRCNSDGSKAYDRKEIAIIIARSESWISQTMSLYEMPEKFVKMLQDGTMPRTVALALLKVNKEKVSEVVACALKLAHEDVISHQERMDATVKECMERLNECEISIGLAEVVGDKKGAKFARQAKQDTDRLLQDARSRSETAKVRMPRLTQDVISRATDTVGARAGKSTGMSMKAIRLEVSAVGKLLDEDKPILNDQGHPVDRRDIALVRLGMQMAVGEITDRSIVEVVSKGIVDSTIQNNSGENSEKAA